MSNKKEVGKTFLPKDYKKEGGENVISKESGQWRNFDEITLNHTLVSTEILYFIHNRHCIISNIMVANYFVVRKIICFDNASRFNATFSNLKHLRFKGAH